MERGSGKKAYADSVSQEDNYYTRMLLLELSIQAHLHIFLFPPLICMIKTNLQHYLCACQQRVFHFHATAHRMHLGRHRTYIRWALCSSLITAPMCLVTAQFHKLTALSSTWRGKYHSVKFCPGCGFHWNVLLQKRSIFHVFHRNGLSTCLCNSLLHRSERCEFSIKLSQNPTGTCGTVTCKRACWMHHAAFLHLKSEGIEKELLSLLSPVRLHLFCTSKRTLSSLITLNTYSGKLLILANKEQRLLTTYSC